MVGRLYRLRRREAKRRAPRALERLGLTEAADRVVKDLLRRHAPPPRPRRQPRRPTAPADPRRADDRARPPQSRIDVWDFIRELVDDGTTVLLTTQYLDEADNLADHIVVIDHGKVIADGTPRELKARMGADVLELHLDDADLLEPTAAALRGIGSGEPSVDLGDRRITLPVHQGAADLMSAVRRLDELGIVPSDLSLRRPSLDDVFLALTGPRRRRRETPSDGATAGA